MQDITIPAASTTVGFMEKIKGYLSPDYWIQRFNLDKEKLINLALYFGAGFFLGFLLKKYSRYVFAFALFSLGMAALMYLDVVSFAINWSKVHSMLGLQSTTMPPDATILSLFWEWAKLNASMAFSFALGFLLGLKVG
jgi:uncharacterized membrane protein (Fun14 family)